MKILTIQHTYKIGIFPLMVSFEEILLKVSFED